MNKKDMWGGGANTALEPGLAATTPSTDGIPLAGFLVAREESSTKPEQKALPGAW